MKSHSSRDLFPDMLRGFALLGIALVNIQYFAVDTLNGFESGDLTNPANVFTTFIVMLLFQSKFYLLFSFLFGYSAHYVIKGEKKNRGRWVGRSIGLILLGVIHFVFFFHGDILFLYGGFALLLLLVYFRSDKALRRWAISIFSVTALMFALLSILTLVGEAFLASQGNTLPEGTGFVSDLNAALASGGFLEAADARFELWLTFAPQALFLQGPLVIVAFLAGVLVARRDGLGSGINPDLMRRFAKWGMLLGLPLQAIASYLFVSNILAEQYSLGIYLISLTINFMTAPILSLGYIGLLWRLSQKLQGLGILQAAGRHSLSIYLGQSVIFSILFSAWGLGLFAELEIWLVALIAVLVWLLLSLLAMLNLRFSSKGPMEALLTSFSKLFAGRA